jgi:hypothetical protein
MVVMDSKVDHEEEAGNERTRFFFVFVVGIALVMG